MTSYWYELLGQLKSPFQLVILFSKWAGYIFIPIVYKFLLNWSGILGHFKCRPASVVILPYWVLVVIFPWDYLHPYCWEIRSKCWAKVTPKIDARDRTRIPSPPPSLFCWSIHSFNSYVAFHCRTRLPFIPSLSGWRLSFQSFVVATVLQQPPCTRQLGHVCTAFSRGPWEGNYYAVRFLSTL